jgi:SAM-dependent methyltransferase
MLPFLPDVTYVGFDPSAAYVEAAKAKHGALGKFLVGRVGEIPPLDDAPFDAAFAFGVLHHLGDAEASRLFEETHALLSPGGRLATYDGCWVKGQPRLARFLISKDRGRAVRTPEALAALARRVFPDVEVHVRHDLLRVPYTLLILVCRKALTPPPRHSRFLGGSQRFGDTIF